MIGTLSHGKNLAEERWLDDGLQKHYTLDLDNPICVLLDFFWKTWPKAQLAPFCHIYYWEATHTCYQRYLWRWIEDFVRVRETETIPFRLHFSKPLDIVVVNNWGQYFAERYPPKNTKKKHRNCLWYDMMSLVIADCVPDNCPFPQFDGSRIFFLTMRRVKSYVPRDVATQRIAKYR